MKNFDVAPNMLNRMVLVQADSVTFSGTQPIVYAGRRGRIGRYWSGLVTSVEPVTKGEKDAKVVVDYALRIKIGFGTSKSEQSITLLFSSDRWRLRFPQQGET